MHAEAIDTSAGQIFWRTLSQAFLPPMDPAIASAFVEALPDDLDDVCAALGMDAPEVRHELKAFREGVAQLGDATALLLEYSRLFLPPAGAATLNLSRLVDSGAGGPCMDALELAYLARGLGHSERLHDFADHAARQFEFLSLLVDEEDGSAQAFAELCLVGALPRLATQLSKVAPDSPYTALTRLAATAARAYRSRPDATVAAAKPNRRHDQTLGVWRHCSACGKPYAREKEISIMSHALEQAGLPSEHLAKCPDCRDRAQGFFRREIA